MKIVLIHPPWYDVYEEYKHAAKVELFTPPLGLCYLAAILKEVFSCEVKVLDAEAEHMNLDEVVKYTLREKPDVVGITSTTSLHHKARYLFQKIKECNEDIFTIAGGPHTTVLALRTLEECRSIDLGVYGEGELTLCEVVSKLKENHTNFEGVRGTVFRRNEELIMNKPREFVQDLDMLPFPDRNTLKLERYLCSVPSRGLKKFTTVITQRGCPYRCIFCSQRTIFGLKTRFRTVESVINELEEITDLYKIDHILFLDDTLTLFKKRCLELCKLIRERGLDLTWEGTTRVDLINRELLTEMKKSGFVRISFGIESGNPKILEIIKKDIDLAQVKRAFKIAKEVGLETRCSVMLGHPYETRQTAIGTLRFIKNLKECDQAHISISTPYPGTELYEMAIKGEGGLKLLTRDFSEFKRYGKSVVEVNDLSREELIRLQRNGMIMFYLGSTRRIWYNIKRAGLKTGMKNAIAFAKSFF